MCLIYICNSLFLNMVHQSDVCHFHQLLVNKVSVGHSFPKSLFSNTFWKIVKTCFLSVSPGVLTMMFIINTIWHDSDLTWWWQKSHFRRKPEFNWTIFFPQLQQFLIYSHFKNGINLWYLNSVVDGYRQMFCIFNLKSVQSKIIIYYNFRFLCVAEKFHAFFDFYSQMRKVMGLNFLTHVSLVLL